MLRQLRDVRVFLIIQTLIYRAFSLTHPSHNADLWVWVWDVWGCPPLSPSLFRSFWLLLLTYEFGLTLAAAHLPLETAYLCLLMDSVLHQRWCFTYQRLWPCPLVYTCPHLTDYTLKPWTLTQSLWLNRLLLWPSIRSELFSQWLQVPLPGH